MFELLQTTAGTDLRVTVQDWSGLVTDAVVADPSRVAVEPSGAAGIVIAPAADGRSAIVKWIGGPCDVAASIDVDAAGSTITVRQAPRPACDAVAIGRAVELRFAAAIDGGRFTGSLTDDLVGFRDVQPYAIFFDSWLHGWVVGTTIESIAVAFETSDGGATWTMTGLGRGRPTVIGGAGGRVLVGRSCPFDGMEYPEGACGPGTFRFDDGRWSAVSNDLLTMVAGRGAALATAALPAEPRRDERGVPVPEIGVTRDGNARTTATIPCGRGSSLSDLAWSAPSVLVGLCEGEGMTGGSEKVMYRSTDDGVRWKPVASTKAETLPLPGTGIRMSIAPDGTGWMWAWRLGLESTRDGGTTWAHSAIVDGEDTWAIGASALGDGSGWLLLHDSVDELHLYRVAADGSVELRSTFSADRTPG